MRLLNSVSCGACKYVTAKLFVEKSEKYREMRAYCHLFVSLSEHHLTTVASAPMLGLRACISCHISFTFV